MSFAFCGLPFILGTEDTGGIFNLEEIQLVLEDEEEIQLELSEEEVLDVYLEVG